MVNTVIRKNADGFDVNFGNLVVCEVAGIRCTMEDWRAKQLCVTVVDEEVIPEFFDDLKLVMQFAAAQIYVYPFNKADIKPLGKALSELTTLGNVERVDVQHNARALMMWKQGVVFSEQKTIDHFYSEMTEEEIERSRF